VTNVNVYRFLCLLRDGDLARNDLFPLIYLPRLPDLDGEGDLDRLEERPLEFLRLCGDLTKRRCFAFDPGVLRFTASTVPPISLRSALGDRLRLCLFGDPLGLLERFLILPFRSYSPEEETTRYEGFFLPPFCIDEPAFLLIIGTNVTCGVLVLKPFGAL